MLDVRKILAKCAAYAPARTPKDNPSIIGAWTEHFAQYPHIDMDDALGAVRLFFNKDGSGIVEPVDISKIAREIHQDAVMRSGPREHDGSNYGRIEYVTDEMSIESQHLPTGDQEFRFCWDGPVHQPFCGAWHSTKQQAIEEGIAWCSRQMVRPQDDVTVSRVTGVEHAPGEPCAVAQCPKPSTFDVYCARHYCLVKSADMGLSVGRG